MTEYQKKRIIYYENRFRNLSNEEFDKEVKLAGITHFIVQESHLWLAALINVGKEKYGKNFIIYKPDGRPLII